MDTKVCSCKGCSKKGEPQPRENFYSDKSRKDGLMHRCKTCQRSYMKGYWKRNKKTLLAKMKTYAESHKDKLREYSKQYRERTKDL